MERPLTDERSYEQLVQDLEACVRDLEEGRLPLEHAIERFKEGVALVKVAELRLQTAEGQVNLLLRGEDGGDRKEPFVSAASGEAPRGPRLATSAPATSAQTTSTPKAGPARSTQVGRSAADDDIPF